MVTYYIFIIFIISFVSGIHRHREPVKFNVTFEPLDQIVVQNGDARLSCTALNFGFDGHIDMEIRKRPDDVRIDICDTSSQGDECYPVNVYCENCFSNFTHGELTILFKNISREQRGTYFCSVMGNVIIDASIEVAVPPESIQCFKSNNTFKTLPVITCDISCTYPEPDFEVVGNIFEKPGSVMISTNCSGKLAGLQGYSMQYVISKATNGTLIKIYGIGYNRTFNIFEIFVKEPVPIEGDTKHVIPEYVYILIGISIFVGIVLCVCVVCFLMRRYLPCSKRRKNEENVENSRNEEIENLVEDKKENGLPKPDSSWLPGVSDTHPTEVELLEFVDDNKVPAPVAGTSSDKHMEHPSSPVQPSDGFYE